MKVFLFTLALAALSAGMANAGWDYSRCANNNSRACTDARNAFASHHGGVFPEQYSMNHHGGLITITRTTTITIAIMTVGEFKVIRRLRSQRATSTPSFGRRYLSPSANALIR